MATSFVVEVLNREQESQKIAEIMNLLCVVKVKVNELEKFEGDFPEIQKAIFKAIVTVENAQRAVK